MDLPHFFSGLIGFGLALLLYFLLKEFLPSYFRAKATNQATKEDIGEITEIVENIKTDLLKSTEELKAYIGLANQNKLNIKRAEQDAFFDFNKKLTAWIYYIVRFDLFNYNETNYHELDNFEAEEARRQYELDLSEGHLHLFYNDNDFYDLKAKLIQSVIELKVHLKITISELRMRIMMYEIDLKKPTGFVLENYQRFHDEKLQFIKDKKEGFHKIFEDVVRFNSLLSRMLFERVRNIEYKIEKE